MVTAFMLYFERCMHCVVRNSANASIFHSHKFEACFVCVHDVFYDELYKHIKIKNIASLIGCLCSAVPQKKRREKQYKTKQNRACIVCMQHICGSLVAAYLFMKTYLNINTFAIV